MPGDTIQVVQGAQLDVLRQIVAADGSEFTAETSPFEDTDTLSCRVWPGDDRATTLTVTPTWADADTGQYYLGFLGSDTEDVAAGIYRFQTLATRGGQTGVVDQGRLEILSAPGSATTPLAFCTYDEMALYCGAWLTELQTDSDQAGFLEQRVRATNRLIDTLCQVWKPAYGDYSLGVTWGLGLSTLEFYGTGAPSRWLRDQLTPLTPEDDIPESMAYRENSDANFVDPTLSTALLLYPSVKELVAKWALAYLFDAQVGRNEDKAWDVLAAKYERQARALFLSTRFELDLMSPQDGHADITIDPGNTSLR